MEELSLICFQILLSLFSKTLIHEDKYYLLLFSHSENSNEEDDENSFNTKCAL